MSDLPSREDAGLIANMRALPLQAFGIVEAYASGRLVDREAIDRKKVAAAAVNHLFDATTGRITPDEFIGFILDAAIGDTDE